MKYLFIEKWSSQFYRDDFCDNFGFNFSFFHSMEKNSKTIHCTCAEWLNTILITKGFNIIRHNKM